MQQEERLQRKGSYKVALIFFGIVLIAQARFFTHADNPTITAAQHWIPTQATIQNENMEQFERKRHRVESCLNTTVNYVFQSKSYQTKLYAECKMTSQQMSAEQVEVQLRQSHPLQGTISIRVNPQQPTQTMATNTFNRFIDSRNHGALLVKGLEIVGAVLIAVGLVGFLF